MPTSEARTRVVITGAAGFIGSHLTEALLDQNCSVVGIDNLITGDLDNIAHLSGRDFTFIKQDVTNYINLDGPVDYVLHWASPASPIDYLNFPIPTLKVGALGTHNALGLALAKRATFVQASTSEVYGDPLEHPQSESYWGNVNPVGPRGVYDEAKRFAEAMTMAYPRYHGLDAKIVRIFNTYGPRQSERAVIGTLVRQVLDARCDAIRLGDLAPERDFTFVDDTVAAFIKAAELDGVANAPVFNAGSGRSITIADLVDRVRHVAGSDKPVVADAGRVRPAESEVMALVADATRFCEASGWRAEIGLDDGLARTVDWWRGRLDGVRKGTHDLI